MVNMKKLFSLYPHIRSDDVLEATDLYLGNIKDVQYVLKANNFILTDKGESELYHWIEEVYEVRKRTEERKSFNNIMQ